MAENNKIISTGIIIREIQIADFLSKISNRFNINYLIELEDPIMINIKFLQVYIWFNKNNQEVYEIEIRNSGGKLEQITQEALIQEALTHPENDCKNIYDIFIEKIENQLSTKYEILVNNNKIVAENFNALISALKTLYFVYDDNFFKNVKIRSFSEKEFSVPNISLLSLMSGHDDLSKIYSH
jgi:hypothetical protein